MKFLIIDDNEKIRKIIIRSICISEDIFLECSDGIEAVSAYTEFLPDYVLMDIQMNKINGIAATKNLLEIFPDARIIIITDHDTPTFRDAAKKAGALAFFSKENLFEVRNFVRNPLKVIENFG